MGLDREGEEARGRQHAGNRGSGGREIPQIDEHIGRDDQIVAHPAARFDGEERHQLALGQPIIDTLAAGLVEHGGGQIDPGEAIDLAAEGRAGKPGAAAEIEHGAEAGSAARAAARGHDGSKQQLRGAVVEAGYAVLEAPRMLVECPPGMLGEHRRRDGAGPEPGQMQARPLKIIAIGIGSRREGRDGALPLAVRLPQLRERKPGRRKAGRSRNHLLENLGRPLPVAAHKIIERPSVAPVEQKIAGREEDRAHKLAAALTEHI